MNTMLAVAVLFMVAISFEKADGACCYGNGGYCGDCTRTTPYCGYRRCNLFGCNCGGGCRRPSSGQECFRTFAGGCRCVYTGRKRRSTEETDTNAVPVFNDYDLNKNGKIEKDEFLGAFNQTGSTNEELVAHWEKLDGNKDDYITMEEFDGDN